MNFRIVMKALTFGVLVISIIYLLAHAYSYSKAQLIYREFLTESVDMTPQTRTLDQTTTPFNEYKYSNDNVSVYLEEELDKKESRMDEARYESYSDDNNRPKKILVLKKFEYYDGLISKSGIETLNIVMNRTGISNYEELSERVMFMKKSDLSFLQPEWQIRTNLSLLMLKHTFMTMHGSYEELFVVEQNDRKIYVYKDVTPTNKKRPYSLIELEILDKNTVYNIVYVETDHNTTLSDETITRLVKSIQIE